MKSGPRAVSVESHATSLTLQPRSWSILAPIVETCGRCLVSEYVCVCVCLLALKKNDRRAFDGIKFGVEGKMAPRAISAESRSCS